MGQVTVEGGYLPAAGVDLRPGERRTVEATPRIGRLVRIGALEVVSGSLTVDAPVTSAPPAGDGDGDGDPHGDGPGDDGVPAGNASRKVWAEFLRGKNIEFPDYKAAEEAGDATAWAGRDDLRVIWQQASGGS